MDDITVEGNSQTSGAPVKPKNLSQNEITVLLGSVDMEHEIGILWILFRDLQRNVGSSPAKIMMLATDNYSPLANIKDRPLNAFPNQEDFALYN